MANKPPNLSQPATEIPSEVKCAKVVFKKLPPLHHVNREIDCRAWIEDGVLKVCLPTSAANLKFVIDKDNSGLPQTGNKLAMGVPLSELPSLQARHVGDEDQRSRIPYLKIPLALGLDQSIGVTVPPPLPPISTSTGRVVKKDSLGHEEKSKNERPTSAFRRIQPGVDLPGPLKQGGDKTITSAPPPGYATPIAPRVMHPMGIPATAIPPFAPPPYGFAVFPRPPPPPVPYGFRMRQPSSIPQTWAPENMPTITNRSSKRMRTEYRCGVCDKVFSSKYRVRRHFLTHTDERPHPCPQCNKRFRQKAHLVGHITAVHELLGDHDGRPTKILSYRGENQRMDEYIAQPYMRSSIEFGR